jgi:hypothetical protein
MRDLRDKIEVLQSRLVGKCYTQSYSVDYQETITPVTKLNTWRILLLLEANQYWPLLEFYVKMISYTERF